MIQSVRHYPVQALDVFASASFLVFGGGASASWQQSQQEDAYELTYQVQAYKDYGTYMLDPNALTLSSAAQALLNSSQSAFLNQYGDRITIGEQRNSYVNCRMHVSQISYATASSLGFSLSASGEWLTGGFSASLNLSSFLTTLSQHCSIEVDISTNVNDPANTLSMVVANPTDANTVINAFSTLMGELDSASPVAYGFVTAPMSVAAPQLLLQPFVNPVTQKMQDEFSLYCQLTTEYDRLKTIVDERNGTYHFLPVDRVNTLQAKRDLVYNELQLLIPRIKLYLLNQIRGISRQICSTCRQSSGHSRKYRCKQVTKPIMIMQIIK